MPYAQYVKIGDALDAAHRIADQSGRSQVVRQDVYTYCYTAETADAFDLETGAAIIAPNAEATVRIFSVPASRVRS